jgi:tRNA A-37 threonylcarbamoyl transferase component Bud32
MPAEQTPPSRRRAGFIHVNPRFREEIVSLGFDTSEAFLAYPGEIISGHPDRHVLRVSFGDGPQFIQAYLKREHRVPWKDRWAGLRDGFGFVSVSCREAAMLNRLQAAGIPVPQWIAVGEDGRGRAFLLLQAVEGAADLRQFALKMKRQSAPARRAVMQDLAAEIARMHEAGIEHPDLYAKHLLVGREGKLVAILDWQRSRKPRRLSWRIRCRDLAALNASLPEELAGRADRLAFMLAYLRASDPNRPHFLKLCLEIEKRTERLLRRSSVREQRLPAYHESQPLIWLDGEALCVTPPARQLFTAAQLEELGYPESNPGPTEFQREHVLPNGQKGRLVRRRTVRRFSRLRNWFRGRRWSSPEVLEAAALLRQERLGATPRLLAFGQRFLPGGVVDSFLLALQDSPPKAENVERRPAA